MLLLEVRIKSQISAIEQHAQLPLHYNTTHALTTLNVVSTVRAPISANILIGIYNAITLH